MPTSPLDNLYKLLARAAVVTLSKYAADKDTDELTNGSNATVCQDCICVLLEHPQSLE